MTDIHLIPSSADDGTLRVLLCGGFYCPYPGVRTSKRVKGASACSARQFLQRSGQEEGGVGGQGGQGRALGNRVGVQDIRPCADHHQPRRLGLKAGGLQPHVDGGNLHAPAGLPGGRPHPSAGPGVGGVPHPAGVAAGRDGKSRSARPGRRAAAMARSAADRCSGGIPAARISPIRAHTRPRLAEAHTVSGKPRASPVPRSRGPPAVPAYFRGSFSDQTTDGIGAGIKLPTRVRVGLPVPRPDLRRQPLHRRGKGGYVLPPPPARGALGRMALCACPPVSPRQLIGEVQLREEGRQQLDGIARPRWMSSPEWPPVKSDN